ISCLLCRDLRFWLWTFHALSSSKLQRSSRGTDGGCCDAGPPHQRSSLRVDAERTSERAAEHARRHEAAQLGQKRGALADWVAESRRSLGRRTQYRLGDDRRIFAITLMGARAGPDALERLGVVGNPRLCKRGALVGVGAHGPGLDEHDADAERARLVLQRF